MPLQGQTLCQHGKIVSDQRLALISTLENRRFEREGRGNPLFCRQSPTSCQGGAQQPNEINDLRASLVGDSLAGRAAGIGFEQPGRQLVLLQQPVELGAVPVGQPGRVGHVAVGQFQQAHEVIALETLLRFCIGQEAER